MAFKIVTEAHLRSLIDRYPILAENRENIAEIVRVMRDAVTAGRKVLVCGNGGSAADSDHIVGELMKGFVLKRQLPQSDVQKLRQAGYSDADQIASILQQGIPAISLTEHKALSTAVLNDNDPLIAYGQQVYVYGNPGDVLIGISTSGNAKNVVYAMKIGKAFGLNTIGFTGSKPGTMDEFCDTMVKVPETETYLIQELHLPVYHTICIMLENELFGE